MSTEKPICDACGFDLRGGPHKCADNPLAKTEKQAPREWWIEMAEQANSEGETEIVPVLWTFDPGPLLNSGLTRVIEHSAYEAVVRELSELQESARKGALAQLKTINQLRAEVAELKRTTVRIPDENVDAFIKSCRSMQEENERLKAEVERFKIARDKRENTMGDWAQQLVKLKRERETWQQSVTRCVACGNETIKAHFTAPVVLERNELREKLERLETELADWKRGADSEAHHGDEVRAKLTKARVALREIQYAYGEPDSNDVVTTTAREALGEIGE